MLMCDKVLMLVYRPLSEKMNVLMSVYRTKKKKLGSVYGL